MQYTLPFPYHCPFDLHFTFESLTFYGLYSREHNSDNDFHSMKMMTIWWLCLIRANVNGNHKRNSLIIISNLQLQLQFKYTYVLDLFSFISFCLLICVWYLWAYFTNNTVIGCWLFWKILQRRIFLRFYCNKMFVSSD